MMQVGFECGEIGIACLRWWNFRSNPGTHWDDVLRVESQRRSTEKNRDPKYDLSRDDLDIPVIIAVTFHEAAHGFVAHLLGDETAWKLGRVSFNPFKHIDPFGTILLPGLLLLAHSPFLFGYAKPVPVNFRALRWPRAGMVLVAAAGPATNLGLAVVAGLSFHFIEYLPRTLAQWLAENLKNALVLNVVLAVFNLFPLPPLDGGRILVGILPKSLATPVVRLEPYGLGSELINFWHLTIRS